MKTIETLKSVATKTLAALILTATLCAGLFAQPAGAQDLYGKATLLDVVTNRVITATGSNLPVDIHGYAGIAELQLSFCNIGGTGSPTFSPIIYGSSDLTNWTTLTNLALSTNKQVLVTNFFTGLITTNNTFVPGTVFTNSGALAQLTVGTTNLEIGIPVDDCPKYLDIWWTVGGTNPTNTFGARLHARGESN